MSAKTAATVFHVSPAGSDAGPGTAERPFATLERARDAVRRVPRPLAGPAEVVLAGGTHRIERTVALGPEDSGSPGCEVLWRSRDGERAVLSGGRAVTGWRPEADGSWSAALEVPALRQLYVGGRRARRAAIAAPAGLEEWGNIGYRTADDAPAGWSHPEDVELVYTDMWVYTYCGVASARRAGAVVEIRMRQPEFTLGYAKEGRQLQGCYPIAVENSRSFLREPGQWFYDRHDKRLFYRPRPGEEMARIEVTAPVTERLLEVRGAPDAPAHHVRFGGITFADATWLAPSERGLVDLQANFTFGPETRLFGRLMPGNRTNAACLVPYHGECAKSPGNVVCHAAHDLVFEGCAFIRLGGAGLDVESGSRRVVVERCLFEDIAGSGIQIGDIQAADHHPADPRLVVRDNVVRDCAIRRVAQDYKGGVGVFVGYTDGTVIEHCEICDLPYSAISVGWGWGEVDAGGGAYVHPDLFDTPTPCARNRVESNHIHHVMLELWDGGAIYTLGEMPGSVIRGNHVHDTLGFPGGIYLDEGSGHIEVSGNVVYRTPSTTPHGRRDPRPLNFNNRAQDRISSCPVRDNHTEGPDAPGFPAEVVARAGPRAGRLG